MNINLGLNQFSITDIKNILNNKNDLLFYFEEENDNVYDNFEILFLLELISEDTDLKDLKNNLINEFNFTNNINVIELINQGVLIESIIESSNNDIKNIEEIYNINNKIINELDEEDYLEYCYPYIIDNNIKITQGRSICLKLKKDLKYFQQLDDLLIDEE